MGRMLESLKQLDGKRQPPVLEAIASRPELLPSPTVPEPAEEEYPFIEVGGPNKKVDGSPGILEARAPGPKQVPTPVEPRPVPEPKPTPMTPPAGLRPLTVAFVPWPTSRSTGRIGPEVVTFHQPDHPVSLQYASLLESMLATCPHTRCPLILLAGACPGAGTTTVLLNLACTGAGRLKRRVALLDGKFRNPSLADRLGLERSLGLADVLAGKVALEAALHTTLQSGLHVVPTARSDDMDHLLTPESVGWLGARLRDRFGIVFMDGPDVTANSGLAALMSVCDGFFLVMPHDKVAVPDDEVIRTIQRLGGKVSGLIHTQFENL
jgi:Mrp family chromosome partitioning ATPase